MKPVTIRNLDDKSYETRENREHNKLMPKAPYRGIFVGSSNAGKTNALMNLLVEHLPFDRLWVIGPSYDQPKYMQLKDFFEECDEKIKKETLRRIREYNASHKRKILPSDVEFRPTALFLETIPPGILDEMDESEMNLVVLDDVILNNKNDVKLFEKLFVRGRHRNCSTIMLVQSFYRTSRLCRLNASWFLLFHPISSSELTMLHRDLGLNIPKDVFVNTILEETKEQFTFCHIDLDSRNVYRKSDFKTPLFSEGDIAPPTLRR